jgi:hypothetical protein
MLGYVLAAIIGLLFVGLCLACLGGGSRARSPREPGSKGSSAEPAADEPTPDRSATATRGEINSARHHTPPA